MRYTPPPYRRKMYEFNTVYHEATQGILKTQLRFQSAIKPRTPSPPSSNGERDGGGGDKERKEENFRHDDKGRIECIPKLYRRIFSQTIYQSAFLWYEVVIALGIYLSSLHYAIIYVDPPPFSYKENSTHPPPLPLNIFLIDWMFDVVSMVITLANTPC